MKFRMLALSLLVAASVWAVSLSLAQSPVETIYKAKCLVCHGATGMADTNIGKSMKVKPANDPEVKKYTQVQMIAATRNGMGKMQPFKDSLTEAQIKDVTLYFMKFVK